MLTGARTPPTNVASSTLPLLHPPVSNMALCAYNVSRDGKPAAISGPRETYEKKKKGFLCRARPGKLTRGLATLDVLRATTFFLYFPFNM